MPMRIQRQRTKGWRMPEGAIYVGRPGRWGNPWEIGEPDPWTRKPMDRAAAVDAYRHGVDADVTRAEIRRHLAGKDLACWCRLDQACHADVLLEIANEES